MVSGRFVECQTIHPGRLAPNLWTIRLQCKSTEVIVENTAFVTRQLFLERKRKLDNSSQPKP